MFFWSVLTFSCELWTLGKAEHDKLQTIETWFLSGELDDKNKLDRQ